MRMRVAIIGAGAAGLASARQVSAEGIACDVLEMLPELGGTWVYTDDVGTDRYGFPVYSAMYKGLRTNLPKEVMGFPDFPFPKQSRSYLTQTETLDFLKSYADHFNLKHLVHFNRMVEEVRPIDNKWQVTSIDKPTKTTIVDIYDAVMICTGHYNDPIVPNIEGNEKFTGKIHHSHDYRTPEIFNNQRVLVVGGGPSGLDVALHVSKVADYVVLSHHAKEIANTVYPANVSKKPDVVRIKDGELVEFVDGSCCGFDAIIYCTGYKYSFPFLHEACHVTVDENHIQPLYKHMLHIEKPTMCFMGIPFNVCAFQMFDLQARFFCKFLTGKMKLPSSEEMHVHTNNEMETRWAKGYTKRQAHLMGPNQLEYYEDLAQDAGTAPIAPVIVKLRDESVRRLYDDLQHFREDRYEIIDNNTFVKVN